MNMEEFKNYENEIFINEEEKKQEIKIIDDLDDPEYTSKYYKPKTLLLKQEDSDEFWKSPNDLDF
jgi:uncharacterized membrane protein